VRGSCGSEKKEQNHCADKSNWFHKCSTLSGNFLVISCVPAPHAVRSYCFWRLSPLSRSLLEHDSDLRRGLRVAARGVKFCFYRRHVQI
jgi:hypothetical protein